MPSLKEYMAKDPVLKALVEARDAENMKKWQQSAIDKLQTKINRVIPLMESDFYPSAVKALGFRVLRGEAEYSAFEGAVTMFDMQTAKAAQDGAIEETEASGETPPDGLENNQPETVGTVNNESDFQSVVNRDQNRLRGGK